MVKYEATNLNFGTGNSISDTAIDPETSKSSVTHPGEEGDTEA